MNTSHPFDLVIGLDRSDKKVDLYHIDTRSGKTGRQTITTSPEALVEHPFGTMKRAMNAGYFLCKGLAAVRAEFSLRDCRKTLFSSSPHEERMGRGLRRGGFLEQSAPPLPRPSPPSDGGEGEIIATLLVFRQSLTVLAYNLKRVLNILGMKELIKAVQSAG